MRNFAVACAIRTNLFNKVIETKDAPETAPNNRRIARNALMLTLRMVVASAVGLYTSRVVLATLGISDYGIYGLVAGVIGMAAFLNSAMSGATSRFLTYEMGRTIGHEDVSELRRIFTTALINHAGIAFVVLILAESVGVWFVNCVLVIPADRMVAANWVFQFSIIAMCVGFTQVPYTAAIIAHERMTVFAYLELFATFSRLGIVYLLMIWPSDKLILYAALTLGVSVTVAMLYRIYCVRHFPETRITRHPTRKYFRKMLSYSGLDLYGNMCVSAYGQGNSVLLNLFFGVIANAAGAISLTVYGTISGLTATVTQAFRPQIIKQYAAGNFGLMGTVMIRSVQFTLLAMAVLAVPFIIEMPTILHMWLGRIPVYAVVFGRLTLVIGMLQIIIQACNAGIHATGNIKALSYICGTLFLLAPCTSWLMFKLGFPAHTLYIVSICYFALICTIEFMILRRLIKPLNVKGIASATVKTLLVFLLSLALTWAIVYYFFPLPEHWQTLGIMALLLRVIGIGLLSFIFVGCLGYSLALDADNRHSLLTFVGERLSNVKLLFHRKSTVK